MAQLFSCEFYEFFKNIFFKRTRPVAAYEVMILKFVIGSEVIPAAPSDDVLGIMIDGKLNFNLH